MVTITKETIIGDFGYCTADSSAVYGDRHALLGCPASRGETVEEACMVHGIDTDELLEELNKQIAAGDAQ